MMNNKWKAADIEACISPCQYHCAFKADQAAEIATVHDYYMIWNFVSYAAGVVPVSVVREDEQRGEYVLDSGNTFRDKIAFNI